MDPRVARNLLIFMGPEIDKARGVIEAAMSLQAIVEAAAVPEEAAAAAEAVEPDEPKPRTPAPVARRK